MTCVNEYGSFFCKGLPIALLNNTNVVVVVFAVGDVFTIFFIWNCQLSGASHGFIKFSMVLSVLNIIWRSIACVGSDFVRSHVGYCMAKQRYRGQPITEGGQAARGMKRVSCQFPIRSP